MPERIVKPKNMPEQRVREIVKTSINYIRGNSQEQATRDVVADIKSIGRYWPEPPK